MKIRGQRAEALAHTRLDTSGDIQWLLRCDKQRTGFFYTLNFLHAMLNALQVVSIVILELFASGFEGCINAS